MTVYANNKLKIEEREYDYSKRKRKGKKLSSRRLKIC